MSLGRRAYNIARGVLGREWDRVEAVFQGSAEAELNQAMNDPSYSVQARPTPPPIPRQAPLTPELARKVLGVSDQATFAEIRNTYQKLLVEIDPEKFPSDLALRSRASQMRETLKAAYLVLMEGQDETDVRFGSLDLS